MMSNRNPFAQYPDINDKRRAFLADCSRGCVAWDAAGREYLLRDINVDDVEFIAGIWRVQNKFEHKVQVVRDQEFVLLEKLDRVERNLFEFYRSAMVGINAYGRYLVKNKGFIVAKYETDAETFWSYGQTLEQARAFLGIRLYDKFMDLIHSVACKNRYRTKQ